MDVSQLQDILAEGSSNSVGDTDLLTDKSPEPLPKTGKKVYRSVFKHHSSSESDSSDTAFSPDKEQKCEGILENLIKSEIHKINKNFNLIKKHRKQSFVREKTARSVLTESDNSETGDILQSVGSVDSNLEMERQISESDENVETDTLTTEETERFASIAQDLDILNTHGSVPDTGCDDSATKLYTGPYGRIKSPFKKFSSFKSFSKGVKRSPRKLPAPSMKRPRLQESNSSDSDPIPEKEKSPQLNEKEKRPSDDDSSDESHDELQIIEESDPETLEEDLDQKLRSKSEKFSLSAINVKSIIHKIITNENVVEMVRKAVHKEFEENEARFEPKMTRSKVKETLETEGNVPHLWGMSPKKKPLDKSSFLDIDLPEEEEDDEDFNPEGLPPDSDEDSESVVSSSCLSDLDSTMPSTPTTPVAPSTPLLKSPTPTSTDNENSQSLLSPMGPPLQNKVPKSSHKASSLARKYQEAMERDEAREEEEELIAWRTRSKFPLKDLSVYDLEANLVAPDITEDLYDTSCDDSEWQQFLYTLVKPDPMPVTEDSVDHTADEEDPEYNYLEEAEKESYDMEDFRDDRAVKVSKKELHLLMDELYDAYGENDPLDAECRKTIKAQTQKFLATSKEEEESSFQQSLVLQVGEHEKRQIDDQMRKHVQLLAQTFVMAQTGKEEHKMIASTAEMYLNEINRFADLSENMYSRTAYRACNLACAIDTIKDPLWTEPDENTDDHEDEVLSAVFKYDNTALPSLSHKQMSTMWTNPCFMFPELLPHGGFFKMQELKRDRARVKFLESEDNLLAMGLEQFKDLNDPKQFIQQFMLPCKSKKQIQIRIKNLNAKAARDNPVKFWKQYRQLPMVPQCAPVFDITMMKAVANRDMELDLLPAWCQILRQDDVKASPLVTKPSKRKRSTQSASFSITSTGVTALYFPPNSSSAPVTPCHQQTDSSQMGSSGSSLESPKSDSQTAKQKPLSGIHRKKLNMDIKDLNSSSGVFVPLTMTSQNKPITVCVLDKLTSTVASSTNSTTVTNSSLINTCVAPTIIFINNTMPVVAKANIQTPAVSAASSAPQSSATVEPVSSGKGKDALQTALLSKDILDGESSNNNAEVTSETDIATYAGGSVTEDDENLVNGKTTTAVSKAVSTASSQTLPNVSVCSADDSAALSTSENWSFTVSTPTHSISDTDDHSSSQMTPEQLTPHSVCSSAGGTPKSAIEIMASYAPYFISPSEKDKTLSSQQQRLETTPKKCGDRYARLVPKPTPPSAGTPSRSYTLRKKLSSPRRKQLQQKARSILPKGFVVSTFDNSPTKRAASSLIGKAKQTGKKPSMYGQLLEGFRKILPHPPKSERVTSTMDVCKSKLDIKSLSKGRRTRDKMRIGIQEKRKPNDSVESMEVDSGTGDDVAGDGDEAGLDDKCRDTESDYTQSEDGNDTQEDSQEELDSQEDEPDEDEAHIANLMQASTTVRSDFSRDEVGKVRLCKKDRDRDISLAMLAPDIIESDPQRDYRDTAFAQAYLHKVKKTLRDDMDTLERFLQLMYNFSKTTDSPVKLYRDLGDLFEPYPELMTDFAGFLLPEQAIACDCYDTHQEFSMARTFLRKLEIYFSKTPHQFQKVMKTFSRWYRKPGRKVSDLQEQVEPMLKGQRYLLEEFSKFFLDEPPPESAMDDFEEITLEDSGEEEKCDSFEEIELLDDDGEEMLGTKRCPCQCHNTGDDNFKKKKKHCYRCCLTVIDGELVYRVNKSTIKRINITFGPSVRAADFVSVETDDLSPVKENKPEPEEDREPVREPDTAEATPAADWLLDNEAAEKENIEDYHLTREVRSPKKHDKAKSGPKKKQVAELYQKPHSPQKIHKGSWQAATSKWARLSDVVTPSGQTQRSSVQQTTGELTVQTVSVSNAVTVSLGSNVVSTQQWVISSPQITVQAVNENNPLPVSVDSKVVSTQQLVTTSPQIVVLAMGNQNLDQNCVQPATVAAEPKKSELSGEKSVCSGSCRSNQASDILATAFNSAMTTEVSLDSMSMPFTVQTSVPEELSTSSSVQSVSNLVVQSSVISAPPLSPPSSSPYVVVSPKALQAFSSSTPTISAPDGKDNLNISKDTNFLKVECKAIDATLLPKVQVDIKETETKTHEVVVDDAVQPTKSQVFSPFSPYASEVQAINSMTSPLATISSPGARCSRSSVNKIRRITPIQVSENSQQSNSSFQSVVENSPIICDSTIHESPFENFGKDVEGSEDKPSVQQEVKKEDVTKSDSQSQHSNLLLSSQKSDSTLKSASSDSVEGPACNIKISEPVTFSEDANEEFPAVPSSTGALLSEESLLHFLGKDAQFDEHIHSISNLTNILHVLEGKSVHGDSKDTKKAQEKNLEKSDNSSIEPKGTVGGSGVLQIRAIDSVFANQSEKLGSETGATNVKSSESDAANKTLTPEKYLPDILQSVENSKRREDNNFKVSRLFDSKSSFQSASSANVTTLTEEPTDKAAERQVKCGLTRDSSSHDGNRTVSVSERCLESNKDQSDWTYKPKYRDKTEIAIETKNVSVEDEIEGSAKETSIILTDPVSYSCDNKGDGSAIMPPCDQERSDSEHSIQPFGDNEVESPMLASCDSEGRKSKRHKDKHKRKKSKKDKRPSDKGSKNVLDRMKRFSCTLSVPAQMSPNVYGQSTGSDQNQELAVGSRDREKNIDASSPSQASSVEGGDTEDQASGVMTSADLCSNISSPCSSTEGPEWSKDTDKTILEACKAHGIREKTFVKIAERIGNVTPKQVRRRFGQLYKLILRPISKQAAKDSETKGSPVS